MTMKWHRHGDQPVDTHILVHHSKAPGRGVWLDQALAALEKQPTNILLVDDPSEDIGTLRAEAHAMGTAPYLGFVDDDDWVMDGAYDACLSVLDANPKLVGVYTSLRDVNLDGVVISGLWNKGAWNPRHQLTHPFDVLHVHIYRREACMQYNDAMRGWHTVEESLLMGLMVGWGDWQMIPIDGYRKRLHGFGAGARIDGHYLLRLTRALTPTLMKRARELNSSSKTTTQRVAGAVTHLAQRAINSKAGCTTCQKTRATVGKAVIKTVKRFR